MHSLEDGARSRKRKSSKHVASPSTRSLKRRMVDADETEDEAARIFKLEEQISESRKHYNNIATLISMLNIDASLKQPNLDVAVALCRVFCRLIATGNLKEPNRATEEEKIIVAWLKERCQEYQRALLNVMRSAEISSQVWITPELMY
jgi:U3 small nucleolar RNA-associated protein 19